MEQATIHTWQTKGSLAKIVGAPSVSAIDSRAYSSDPKWAHYEHAHPNDVSGAFSPQAKEVFRIRPGCDFDALEVEAKDSPEEDEGRAEKPTKAPAVNLADQAARIASLERELAAAREKIEEWKRRATEAEHDLDIEGSHLAAIGEALEPIGDFAGKDTPVEERITRLVERSIRDHADLYAMQQVALEFMEKYGVSDEGWKDAEMADYVRAACQGIEDHYDKQFAGVEDMREALRAVHRECERREYGSDDKRAAVEKVTNIIDGFEVLEQQLAAARAEIKEWKREAFKVEGEQGERHDIGLIVEDWERIKAHLVNGGHPAIGSCLAPTIEKLLEHSVELQDLIRLEADGPTDAEAPLDRRLEDLVDLEFEIANQYARRATDDFAELEQRCRDLKQAKKHYRRREVLMAEWCEEEGR